MPGCSSENISEPTLKRCEIDFPSDITFNEPVIGDVFTIDNARQYASNMAGFLSRAGYLDAKIKWNWRIKDGSILYNLKAENILKTSTIEMNISGIKRFSDSFIKWKIFSDPAKEFDSNYPARILEKLISLYAEYGYLKAYIILTDIEKKNNILKLYYRIYERYPVYLQSIKFQNIKRSEPSFLARITSISKNELLTKEKIETARERLYVLGYYESFPKVYWADTNQPGKADLIFELDELKTYLISGVISASPDTSNTILGQLDIRLGNLGGRGRNVDLYWLSQKESELELSYLEPRPLNVPFDIKLSISRQRKPDIFTKFDAEIDVLLYLSRSITFTTGLGVAKSISEDEDSASNYSQNLFITALKYKNLDNPFIPKKGMEFGTGYKWIIHTSKESEKSFRLLNESYSSLYIPFYKRISFYFSPKINWLYSRNSNPDIYDWIDLGGLNGVRGLKPDMIKRTVCLVINNQFNLYPHPRFWVYPLLDYGIGFKHNYKGKEFCEIGRLGYGFGVRMQRQAIKLGLDYAIERKNEPLSGYLYLSASTLW
ncbi:MAG: BamA/TamA family outer membrane protein [Candidatus Coatesbacteria bacterium]|nr:BamA/TamA family outer membrane protein [Candidatus Coatesbacteria bacterium]